MKLFQMNNFVPYVRESVKYILKKFSVLMIHYPVIFIGVLYISLWLVMYISHTFSDINNSQNDSAVHDTSITIILRALLGSMSPNLLDIVGGIRQRTWRPFLVSILFFHHQIFRCHFSFGFLSSILVCSKHHLPISLCTSMSTVAAKGKARMTCFAVPLTKFYWNTILRIIWSTNRAKTNSARLSQLPGCRLFDLQKLLQYPMLIWSIAKLQ